MLGIINGTYGNQKTPCEIFIDGNGWYVVEGGTVVNMTDPCLLVDGVDVETLPDYDCFTWSNPIEDLEEFEEAIND